MRSTSCLNYFDHYCKAQLIFAEISKVSKVPKVKAPSSGSIDFDFKAQEKDENRSVVWFSPSKRSTLKEELLKRAFASFASVCKRASRNWRQQNTDKFNNYSKEVESSNCSYFNILYKG